ncbi:MAG: hypothetical protein FWG78_02745 [Coriobacteriia bacterium]|nr:hypothetical protein [Coriobacteriia bacterium]
MRRYDIDIEAPIDEVTELAIRYVAVRRTIANALADSSRLTREYASQVLRDIADTHVEMAIEFIDRLIDALSRPEALTRYNALAILHLIANVDVRVIDRAWEGIEECLYDEHSGEVRLGAFRLLTMYGASTPTRSKRAWPLISDALRCYHGDPEFVTMLNEFMEMIVGDIDDDVRKEVNAYFKFDAANAHGPLKRKAMAIVRMTARRRTPRSTPAPKKAPAKTTPVPKTPAKKPSTKASAKTPAKKKPAKK